VNPYWRADNVALYCADCLDVLPTIADSSVNLIATDPPYFRVKNEPWDRQWDTAAGFLAWLDKVLVEFYRVLAPNGSLYVFASPKMAARVEVLIGQRFNVLNRIRWQKEAGWHNKARPEDLRSYLSPWEEIIFAEHHGADNIAKGEAGYTAACDQLRGFVFEPLRAYLAGEWQRAGLTFEDARQAVGCADGSGLPSHWFTTSQWMLPTAEKYQQLREYANRHGGEYLRREYEGLRREYEYLRREYEDLRREYEDLRRPFNATADAPYTDVWTFATVPPGNGKHPCEKPLDLMAHIVAMSSKPGDLVLDPFMGRCTTGLAAWQAGRRFVGIDQAEQWCRAGQQRLAQEHQLEMEGIA
jgi:site-specific DNA-methyltransferase (adenine-specific)